MSIYTCTHTHLKKKTQLYSGGYEKPNNSNKKHGRDGPQSKSIFPRQYRKL